VFWYLQPRGVIFEELIISQRNAVPQVRLISYSTYFFPPFRFIYPPSSIGLVEKRFFSCFFKITWNVIYRLYIGKLLADIHFLYIGLL